MRRLLPLILSILFLIVSCSAAPTATADRTPPTQDELVGCYLTVIDTMYSEDTGLNEGKYVAVDTSGMNNLNRASKDKLLKGAAKYGTVLEKGIEQLKAEGYIMNTGFADGILFVLKDMPFADGVITVDGEKFKTAAAADYCKFDFRKVNGSWVIDRRYGQARS